MAKRKKAVADLNYKVIQEKERVTKEQKLKKRELDNFENLEMIKKQVNSNLLNTKCTYHFLFIQFHSNFD